MFERKKSRLRRVNDRREMRREWPTRYHQSISGVPQQWIKSARDTRKPGIGKVNGTNGSIFFVPQMSDPHFFNVHFVILRVGQRAGLTQHESACAPDW